MAFGNLYQVGLASTDPGSPNDLTKIYGNGTLWGTGNGNVRAGDSFEHAGIRVTILSVENDEELTLAYAWPGAEFTDQAYIIRQESPTRHTPSELASRTNELLSLLNIYKKNLGLFLVEEFAVNTPPTDYVAEEMLVVGTSPTGVFAGHSNEIAEKTASGWAFYAPEHGWITIDRSTEPNDIARNWNETAGEWQTTGSLLGAPIWSGEWSASETYAAGALVSYLNKIYAADVANTNVPPNSSPSSWTLFLEIGEHGGALTLGYFFRTSVDASAAEVAGQLNLDATPGSATRLRLNIVDAFGNDWASTLASLADGTSARLGRVRLIVPGDPTRQWQATVLAVEDSGSPADRFDLVLDGPELGQNTFVDNTLVLFMWTDVGNVGSQGVQGDTGARGAVGGPIAIPYVFKSPTADADPTPGGIRLSDATQNLSTVIRADLLNSALADVTGRLDAIPVIGTGAIIAIGSLVHATTPESKWIDFKVTAYASPTGYRNLTIEVTSSSAANPFADGDAVVLNLTPLLVGATGDTGTTGATGADFDPDFVVASIDLRDAYDAQAVGTSVLVEQDSNNGGKATVYFLLASGSPVEWSQGVDFAPGADTEAISHDDTDSQLSAETGTTVNTAKTAIDALATIAKYLNDPETSIASAATADISSGANGNHVKWVITGTVPVAGLGGGANRFLIVRYAAALPLTYNATSMILLDGQSRVNAENDFSIFVTDASGNAREIYYSGR